jgi:hypothetical protein
MRFALPFITQHKKKKKHSALAHLLTDRRRPRGRRLGRTVTATLATFIRPSAGCCPYSGDKQKHMSSTTMASRLTIQRVSLDVLRQLRSETWIITMDWDDESRALFVYNTQLPVNRVASSIYPVHPCDPKGARINDVSSRVLQTTLFDVNSRRLSSVEQARNNVSTGRNLVATIKTKVGVCQTMSKLWYITSKYKHVVFLLCVHIRTVVTWGNGGVLEAAFKTL